MVKYGHFPNDTSLLTKLFLKKNCWFEGGGDKAAFQDQCSTGNKKVCLVFYEIDTYGLDKYSTRILKSGSNLCSSLH